MIEREVHIVNALRVDEGHESISCCAWCAESGSKFGRI